MQVVGDAARSSATAGDTCAALRAAGEAEPATLERFAFYERAAAAFAVLQTGERRRYGNIILRKGVVDA
jgi:L-fucose mutarotase